MRPEDVIRMLMGAGGGTPEEPTETRKVCGRAITHIQRLDTFLHAADASPELASALLLQCEAAMLDAAILFREAARLVESGVPLNRPKPEAAKPAAARPGSES